MKFKLTTDSGTYHTIKQEELYNIELILQLSNSLVSYIYKEDIDSFSDDIKGHCAVLNQMFFELSNSKNKNSNEVLTENEFYETMPTVTEKQIDVTVLNNVIKHEFKPK